jgi:hypothetical protein
VTAGYSGTPLPKKLGIKQGSRLAIKHAPEGFAATLGELPPEAESLTRLTPGLDVIVAFYTSRAALMKEWSQLTRAAAPNGTVWVAWPKRASAKNASPKNASPKNASRVATDITEDVVRELLLPSGWVDNKVCAIDDTWSALRFALRRELR